MEKRGKKMERERRREKEGRRERERQGGMKKEKENGRRKGEDERVKRKGVGDISTVCNKSQAQKPFPIFLLAYCTCTVAQKSPPPARPSPGAAHTFTRSHPLCRPDFLHVIIATC